MNSYDTHTSGVVREQRHHDTMSGGGCWGELAETTTTLADVTAREDDECREAVRCGAFGGELGMVTG